MNVVALFVIVVSIIPVYIAHAARRRRWRRDDAGAAEAPDVAASVEAGP